MKQFRGTIAGKKLSDFNQYDNVKTFKERMEYIEDLILSNEFFSTYFSEYYNVSPNQNGYLSEQDTVCKTLDFMGTYILESRDIKSNRKVEYRFWKNEQDYRRFKDSENVNESSINKSDDNTEVIDMFVDNKHDKNQKIVKNTCIRARDIKEIKEIKELEKAIAYLKSETGVANIKKKVSYLLEVVTEEDVVNRLTYILNNTERYIASYVKNLKEDQVLIKKAVRRPVEFKNVLKDEGMNPDWISIIDFENDKCVKVLLESLCQKDLSGDDFQLILWDLYEFITNKLKLSKRESEVIDLFAKGFKQVDIVKEFGTNKQTVRTYVSRIIKKIQDSGYDIE